MKLLLIDNTEPGDGEYNVPLLRAAERFSEVTVINYKALPSTGNFASEYDRIIISGVPVGYGYDTLDSRLPYLQWLPNCGIPVLGICLGHQNIGRLFGAKIIKDEEAEEGPQPLEILQNDPLLAGIKSGQTIIASHRGSISLPENFILLASTPACKNQIMRHAARAIYGVQFHPEFSETGMKLLCNFVTMERL